VAALYALLSERIPAVRVVRSFAKEEAELAELDDRIDAHRALGLAGMKATAWQGGLATLICGLGTSAVVVYGAVLAGRGRLTVGELLASCSLVAQLYSPITRLAGFQSMMAATLVAVDRITDLLDEPETISDRPKARRLRRPKGGLTYRGVTFAYRPGGRPVLDRVDLKVEPGMTVGLFGASGSGKSTLLALAPRIYDLDSDGGSILLDGRDVRSLGIADLRRAVALVPQQAMLFEGTFRSNLSYAAPDADPGRVRRALETADLATLVESLPLGLDAPVGERGQTLSGGQRQRLALARALVADPAVLLLDDCTSALDAETEARIQSALRRHRPGRTSVIVSHKVSSVRDADLIVVLDAGRVAEQGTHDELVRLGGLYGDAYLRQTGVLMPAAARPGRSRRRPAPTA
jgi:ABC-type multidrug transport system fused ATPase/permease subunit